MPFKTMQNARKTADSSSGHMKHSASSFLEHGVRVNTNHFDATMWSLKEVMKMKFLNLSIEKLILHNNINLHTTYITMQLLKHFFLQMS